MMSDGLRERSKARRREAILGAAYRLFAERGFDSTTIAEIAELAEVSPRTVTLYFPSKLELALARFNAFADRLGTALRARPTGQSAIDALELWLRDEIDRRGELDVLYDRMLELNPQLKGICGARLAEVVQEGARLLAEELGRDPGDFAPRMVAAAVAAVVGEVVHQSEPGDIDTAMAFLRAGAATIPAAALR
jgi:AcrR family transcriptional regulator